MAINIGLQNEKKALAMYLQQPRIITLFLVLLSLGLACYAYTNPGVAVCAMANRDQKTPAIFGKLLEASRNRIQVTFGRPEAKPIVVFFNDVTAFWPFKLNDYGSTQFIGDKVCVMIGSKGQNLYVLTHELMHAEIAYQVGYWRRDKQLPVWFDEGLAMQFDFRPCYSFQNGKALNNSSVKKL